MVYVKEARTKKAMLHPLQQMNPSEQEASCANGVLSQCLDQFPFPLILTAGRRLASSDAWMLFGGNVVGMAGVLLSESAVMPSFLALHRHAQLVRLSRAGMLAGWDCVERTAANLRPSTIKTLTDKANTCVTTVTPSFKTAWHCRSITLVTGSVIAPRGKAHGQVLALASRLLGAKLYRLPCFQGVMPEQHKI
jgi:hypothetical protein